MTKLKLVGLLLIIVQIVLFMAAVKLVRAREDLQAVLVLNKELLALNEKLRTACTEQTSACETQTSACAELRMANVKLQTVCAETVSHLKGCLDQKNAHVAVEDPVYEAEGGKGTWFRTIDGALLGIDRDVLQVSDERRLLVKCVTDAEFAALPDRPDVCLMATGELAGFPVERRTGILLVSCDK